MGLRHGWIGVMLAAMPAASLAAQDCGRPKTIYERLVCSNDRLSDAHERFAFAYFNHYRRASSDASRDAIRRAQRDWEVTVRDACMDVPCLMQAFEERTLELEQR